MARGRIAWIALLLALTALHVALPLARPLHIDTYFTGGKMMLGWDALWEDLKVNAYPPLFYVGLKLYTSVAGLSLFALYLPSMLATILCAPALAWAMRPWTPDPRVRFCAAALAGIHPFLVLYGSGYAKAYALMYLAMILGAGAWARMCQGQRRSGAFAACCLVASQLHPPALVLPLVCLAHAALLRRPRLLGRAAVVLLGCAALYALMWARVEQRLVQRVGLEWLGPRTLHHLGRDMLLDWQWFLLGSVRPSIFAESDLEQGFSLAFFLLVVGAAVLAIRRGVGAGSRPAVLFLRVAILLPVAGFALLDRVTPVWFFRYVGFLLFPAAVLAAAAAGALWHRRRRGLALALLAVLLGARVGMLAHLGTLPVFRAWEHSYREGVAEARARGADLLVLDKADWHEVWTRYLFRRAGEPPPGVAIAWIKGWPVPRPGPLTEAVAGRTLVLVTGHGWPQLTAIEAGRWERIDAWGFWLRYDERDGRIHRHTLHALFRHRK